MAAAVSVAAGSLTTVELPPDSMSAAAAAAYTVRVCVCARECVRGWGDFSRVWSVANEIRAKPRMAERNTWSDTEDGGRGKEGCVCLLLLLLLLLLFGGGLT